MVVPPERVATSNGPHHARLAFPVLSSVLAALLAIAAAIQLVLLVRDLMNHNGSDLVGQLPSGLAGLTAAAALFSRSPERRAQVLGAAGGIWAASAWDVRFLVPAAMPSILHWFILGLIGVSILAGWREGSLPPIRRLVDLAGVAAVVTALIFIAVEFAVVVIELTINPLTI
jgi:hypothetical protein